VETLGLLEIGCFIRLHKSYLNECIVEQEHGSGQVPDPGPAEVEHLANVANVSEFGMTEAKFPGAAVSAAHSIAGTKLTRQSKTYTAQT